MFDQFILLPVAGDRSLVLDSSHDDLWSAQAKRYQRLVLDPELLPALTSGPVFHGPLEAISSISSDL